MDLLQIFDSDKLHYMYIKGIGRFIFHKTKNKNKKNTFASVAYSVLVVKMYWHNIKKFVSTLMVHNL